MGARWGDEIARQLQGARERECVQIHKFRSVQTTVGNFFDERTFGFATDPHYSPGRCSARPEYSSGRRKRDYAAVTSSNLERNLLTPKLEVAQKMVQK